MQKDNLLVLGGTWDGALEQFLKDYAHIKSITFCLDNDEAGRKATKEYMKKYETRGYDTNFEIPEEGKDFNEYLKLLRTKKFLCAIHLDRRQDERGRKKLGNDSMIEKEINAMIAADNYDELVEHTIRNIRKWRFHGKK